MSALTKRPPMLSSTKCNILRENGDTVPSLFNKPHNHKSLLCKIHLLDDSQNTLEYVVSKCDLGRIVFTYVCASFGDLIECDYFGLIYKDKRNQKHWLELDRSVYKQLKRCGNSELYFRIKHYPSDPVQGLKQDLSRYLVYLQIRRDLLHGRINCPTDLIGTIGGLIAQAEVGDLSLLPDTSAPVSDVQPNDAGVKQNYPCSQSLVSGVTSPYMSENCGDFETNHLKDFKIFHSQTPEMAAEITLKHREYRGWTAKEAETEVLRLVSKLPTYGMVPLPVTIKQKLTSSRVFAPIFRYSNGHKGSHTLNNSWSSDKHTSVLLPIGSPVCLGISGLFVSIGPQQTQEYRWDVIHRLTCDGKRLVVHLKKDKIKSGHLIFECESKTAALSLWRWTLDRMYFFTLKESSQAKKVRSNGSLLRRHNTYRFSGRSQQELLSLPIQKTKMEFVRPSTLGHSNVPVDFLSGSTTLPDRRKPIMDLHNENHVEVKEAPPLANLPDDPTLTGVLPISVSEQPLTEECALPTQAEMEEIRTETEKDGATLPQLHKEDGEPVQETKYHTIPPFEDFVTDSQDTVIEKTVEPGESAMLQQPVFEQALSALDCAINEHACDLGMEHSMRTPENVNNEVIQNGCETVHQNGPVQQRPAFEQSEQVDLKVVVQASDSKERQNVNAACVTAQVTATVVVMMMLVGMLVALESTPIAESSMLRFIRGNPLITGVRSYIYGPVRNLIVSGLSLLWS